MTPYGSKTVAECVRRFENGESITDVSRDTGVSKSAIGYWCKTAGVKPRLTHRRFTDEEIMRASAMWAKGVTAREIAAELGIEEQSVFVLASGRRKLFPKRNNGGMRYTEERVRALESEIERLRSLLRVSGIEP